jgi:tRNA(Arg) A34 adenosine deaminase TadA
MGVAADSASAARKRFMRIALKMAERGMAAGGPPVGACLVRAGEVVVAAHNSVIGELDVTAHAEITVIRQACRELRSLSLDGCSLYVTVEPCPMCMAACFYAGIQEIVFGAPISAMQALTASELCVSADELFADKGTADRAPQISGGVLKADCLALLANWQPLTGAKQR